MQPKKRIDAGIFESAIINAPRWVGAVAEFICPLNPLAEAKKRANAIKERQSRWRKC